MKDQQQHPQRLAAFTLTELMVVLIIVGILVLLAMPRLLPLITKTRATEAKLQLGHVYKLQKAHHMMFAEYSNDLNEIDFEQEKLTDEGGTANYRIEMVEASTGNFIARATAIKDFDGDGEYNVWEIDQDNQLREVKKD